LSLSKINKTLLYLFLLCALTAASQHSSNYIQYMFNGALLNPAYCGSQNAINITGLYRTQWVMVQGAPVSKSFSCIGPLKNKKINLGVTLENDRYAVFDHTLANLQYAYRVNFKDGKLAFGLQAGINSSNTNWNKIVVTENNDPSYQGGSTRALAFIAGTGIYFNNDKLYLGISSPLLFSNTLNKFSPLTLNSGYLLGLSGDFKVKPSMLIRYVLHSPLSVNVASTFYYREIVGIGIGYTSNEAMMALIDLRLNDQLRFGYGYESHVNQLNTWLGGSHEIMVRYILSYKVRAVSARYF
jgi:type IX secretion system PorP/SprF family membrane protein